MVAGSVGVVVGTFGPKEWALKGEETAQNQRDEGVYCIHVHAGTLADARNFGSIMLDAEYVVFLDADDDLAPGYCEAMQRAAQPGLLLQPATRGRVDGVLDDFPLLIPRANLYQRNYLVIGTAVNRIDFITQGGFRDLPVLEDWECWIRMIVNGAAVKSVPDAVYIVNVHPESRNSQAALHGQVYRQIQREYEAYESLLRRHTYI